MINTTDLEHWADFFKQARLILIILPENASFDQQLAAASLNLSLEKSAKKTNLYAVTQISNPSIVGLEKLSTKLGTNHLLVSFDYSATSVDKVSYHLDDKLNKFYLTIKPQKGEKPLDKDSIQLEYVGADADLIILFGVSKLDDLEQLYVGYEDLYQSANILCIDSTAPSYQATFVNSASVSSSCELIYRIIKETGNQIDTNVATNLLAGIQFETDNFLNSKADADTFESVAALLKFGARRKMSGFNKQSINSEGVAQDKLAKIDTAQSSQVGDDNIIEESNTQIFSGGKTPEDILTQRPSGLRK